VTGYAGAPMGLRALAIGVSIVLVGACASAPPACPPPAPPAALQGTNAPPTPPSAASPAPTTPPAAPFTIADWGYAVEEAAIESLVQRASQEHPPESLVFDHVTLVSMTHPGSDADRRVVVEGGVVRAVGPAATTPAPPGARMVDGRGRWLMPGLVDMHVHTFQSSSSYLLDLASGVTSVREMNGFPWLLAMRSEARAGRMLVPSLYVAGHLLTAEPPTPSRARCARWSTSRGTCSTRA